MTQAPRQELDRLGDLFINAKLLTPEQVTRVSATQAEHGLRFGEAAVRLGFVSNEQVRTALARQFHYAISRSGQTSVAPSLAIAHAPFGREAEAIRQIRTQLSLRLEAQPQIAVAIVGTRDGEGKSYLAASLAIAFSQAGLRTLFIDADMRRTDRPSLFGGPQTQGLSTILAGRAEAQVNSPLPEFPLLQVIERGPLPPNPSEILGTSSLYRLIQGFSPSYDICIVDTSSTSASGDAQIIARQIGACVLVARQHLTTLNELRQTHAQLLDAGVAIHGIVYNQYHSGKPSKRKEAAPHQQSI